MPRGYIHNFKRVRSPDTVRNDYIFTSHREDAMVWDSRLEAECHCTDLNSEGGIIVSTEARAGEISNLEIEEQDTGKFIVAGDYQSFGQ
jgi:hypothetical protein